MNNEYMDMQKLEEDKDKLHSYIKDELEIESFQGVRILLNHYRKSLIPESEQQNQEMNEDLDYYG